MKRACSISICTIFLIVILHMSALADMGPKPSVTINFDGINESTYYATLLSEEVSTGPYTAITSDTENYAQYQKGDDDYEVFLKFVQYEDINGFYFLQFFEDCTMTDQLRWTYYPPEKFKILLYFPESDTFISSDEIYERYAFDSHFIATIQDNSIVAEKSFYFTSELSSFIKRLFFTLLIEILIALLFQYKKISQLKLIVLINIATQIFLNVALRIGSTPGHLSYAVLEGIIIVIEAIIYSIYINKNMDEKKTSFKPIVYALVANAASFFFGLGLYFIRPDMF